MKTEEETKKLVDKLEKIDEDKSLDGFYSMTDKCGHWLDCLAWVLGE